jgi:ferric-dicitrate binding protein FerR (iron transport regulator)
VKALATVAIVFLLSISAYASSAGGTGILEGELQVSVAKAVELADGNSTTQNKPDYADYPLVVTSKDGKNEVLEIKADRQGHYRVALPAGEYLLQARKRGRRAAPPRPFVVVAGQTVRVNFEIGPALDVMSPR